MADILEIFEEFDTVAEMSADPTAGMVPLPRELVEEISSGDSEPRFATFVIESGWSKSKRYWGPELFNEVAEQINAGEEPIVGYLGHIKPEDDSYSFPEIQLHWLKARVQRVGDKARLAVKAYVLPGTRGRDYLKRGLVRTVSWRGKAAQIPFEKGVRVAKFNIESIDLSRPGKAGMSARLVGALTSEMEQEEKNVKPEEIAALQENELRAHNSGLVSTIEATARKPLEDRVSEMESANESLTENAETLGKVRSALGISEDADVLEVVGKMMEEVKKAGRTAKDALLASALETRFKDAGTRKLVAAALVGEMNSLDVKGDDAHKADDEKLVGEMVDNYINRDDDLKALVSEMEDNPPAPPGTAEDRGKPRELKPGYSSANIRVRSAR